jgi:hypothetical protein|tara:strand:- start:1531 stop:1857 length:327 start_codon:yes stop_codon:yes gene_type:complete
MKKDIAKELEEFALVIRDRYSNKQRAGNFNNETFEMEEIIPMSDHTATVIFKKDTGKKAAFFFYYINMGRSKGWKYFVPTDSHILGMANFSFYKMQVERENYKHNFNK